MQTSILNRQMFVQNDLPTWGLIVLLVAKSAGLSGASNFSMAERDASAGILRTQRSLAEITEMVRNSIAIHRSLSNFAPSDKDADLLNFGNKMALLCGDYLLSRSHKELARIRNQDVLELISTGLRDLVCCEFVGRRDAQNHPLPSRPVSGDWRGEWTTRNTLGGGNLLGWACQGCFLLSGHEEGLNREAFVFGKHLALAWQGYLELKSFAEGSFDKGMLVSVPVGFHLHAKPGSYSKVEGLEWDDYKLLYEEVMDGDAVVKSREVQREMCDVALEKLEAFPEEGARNVLKKIVNLLMGRY